jgi:hypothetical protein
MEKFALRPRIVTRSEYFVVYIKDSSGIVDFLNITGAHNALMSLENIRILKEMRNSVNRIVNCETANLEKTVNASIRQMDNILYIKEQTGFDNLSKNLREIAELRVRHRDIDLKELGALLNPPLGKSGVNHRLRKLDQIAGQLRFSHKGLPALRAADFDAALSPGHAQMAPADGALEESVGFSLEKPALEPADKLNGPLLDPEESEILPSAPFRVPGEHPKDVDKQQDQRQ